MVKLTFLGTGGSFGNPVLTCNCTSCVSSDPRDRRLRSSVLLEWEDQSILVDAGPDFRQQALRVGLKRLDGVWFTHAHADHAGGVDDLRPFCFGGRVLPVLGLESVLSEISRRFSYAFRVEADPSGVSHPLLLKTPLDPDTPFQVAGKTVTLLPVPHGPFSVVGYRIGDLAYLTDLSELPDSTLERMRGLDTLVLSALRDAPHPTHLSLEQARDVALRVGAKKTYLTHFAHGRTHEELKTLFPETVTPAYDGLVIYA
jgi:phosphoribosyl 1,2-cyclic phosphate phosphodiesterase